VTTITKETIPVRNPLPAIALVLGLAGPALAGDGWHIRQSGTVGCEQRSDVEQILNFPVTGNFRALLRELLMTGRCFLLAGGTEVAISSRARTGDIVLVRRLDETPYLYVDVWHVEGPDGEPPE
jgi:hypothetical protein